MPCPQWNDDWIAHLYDELDPRDTAVLRQHLAVCAECTRELESLAACRAWIGRNAPGVPASPRVILVGAGRARRSWFSFAGGLAAASLLFAAGVLAAPLVRDGRSGVVPAAGADLVTLDRFEEALARHSASVESRLDKYDAALTHTVQPPGRQDQTWVTRQYFEQETADLLQRFEREKADLVQRMERSRARDMQMVYDELEATEARAMLAYVLRNDPRFSEK